MSDNKYYVLVIKGDVEPTLVGPFNSEADRDAEAKRLKAADENEEHGIFALNSECDVSVEAYSGGYLRGMFD